MNVTWDWFTSVLNSENKSCSLPLIPSQPLPVLIFLSFKWLFNPGMCLGSTMRCSETSHALMLAHIIISIVYVLCDKILLVPTTLPCDVKLVIYFLEALKNWEYYWASKLLYIPQKWNFIATDLTGCAL